MAQSKCPKCDTTRFEVKTIKPELSKFDVALVQCAACGSVVGALQSSNIFEALVDIEKHLLAILNQINQRLIALSVH